MFLLKMKLELFEAIQRETKVCDLALAGKKCSTETRSASDEGKSCFGNYESVAVT